MIAAILASFTIYTYAGISSRYLGTVQFHGLFSLNVTKWECTRQVPLRPAPSPATPGRQPSPKACPAKSPIRGSVSKGWGAGGRERLQVIKSPLMW